MSGATAASSGAVTVRRGRGSSLTGQRRWALWGSYAALAVFVAMFLTPPFYMVMTSLKTSAEDRAPSEATRGLRIIPRCRTSPS